MGFFNKLLKSKQETPFEKGTKLLNERRFRDAIDVFQSILLNVPSDAPALGGLVMAYAITGNQVLTHRYADLLSKTHPDLAQRAVQRSIDDSQADLPKYGPNELPVHLTKLNRTFVEEVIQKAGSREKASAHAISLGWGALNAGDLRVAMNRFNQAWLLTPDDPNIYWGFGCVSSEQSKHEQALSMMDQANGALNANGYFLCDYGRVYLKQVEESVDARVMQSSLQAATSLFQQAALKEPHWRMTFLYWGIALARKFDFIAAREQFIVLGRLGEPVESILKSLDLGVQLQSDGYESIDARGKEILSIILRECAPRLSISLWEGIERKPHINDVRHL